jgi:MFS family permease
MSRTFTALSIRNYRWYLTGQVVTNVGTWMQRVGQDWLVLDISHGNALTLGITTALQFIPFVVIAPLAGVLADRVSRRLVMVIAGLLAGTAALALGAAVMADSVSVGLIYLLAFVLGVAAALDNPARQALLGQLVPTGNLANAVALNSATFNLSRIVGPAAAGVTIALVGIGPVFVINAASYLVALLAVAALRPKDFHGPSPQGSAGASFAGGVRYVRRRPDLLIVLGLVAVVATFACNYQITTALMANQEFKVGVAAYGVMGSVLACGSILGSLLAARRHTVGLRFVIWSGIAVAVVTFAAGLMPNYPLFLAFLPLCGLLILTFTVSAQSYLQLAAGDHVRGRVMGLYTLVFFGGNPVGAPLLGLVARELGPRWGLLGGGALATIGVAVIAGLAVARRRSRNESRDATPPDQQVVRGESPKPVDLTEQPRSKVAVRVR